MKSYQDLIVWQKSIELVCEVYLVTRSFPDIEKYGLVSQMRRSAVSVPSNIAEGYSRKSIKENSQFVNIAFGSAAELQTQLIIAKKLNFITKQQDEKLVVLLDVVLRMLCRHREALYSKI